MRFASLILLMALAFSVAAQSPDPIVAAVEAENWQTARAEINKLRSTNGALFREKNYDYLLGRIKLASAAGVLQEGDLHALNAYLAH